MFAMLTGRLRLEWLPYIRGGFCTVAAFFCSAVPLHAAEPIVALHVGQLLADPSNGQVSHMQTVLVSGDRILSIQSGYVSPDGAEVIDLRTAFVMPGLIDSHVHLTDELGPTSQLDEVKRSTSMQALVGAANALNTLRAGFTTVADLGARNEAIFALRDAIDARMVPGPRIVAAGSPITAHGGHGDSNGFAPVIMDAIRPPSVCSGADDCRRAVREQIRQGANVIKVTVTGGVLSNTAAGLGRQFTIAELEAIVDAAHSLGRRVTAHAHAADGIHAFLGTGGDSVEHGTYLDDAAIDRLRATGAFLIPTFLPGATMAAEAKRVGTFLTPAQAAKAVQAGERVADLGRRLARTGVKVAFGSDTGVTPHGQNAREFALMVRSGFSPLQAIQAATVGGAEHLGVAAEVGRVTPGRLADLVAVQNSPLIDVTELERVVFVMRNGKVVISTAAAN